MGYGNMDKHGLKNSGGGAGRWGGGGGVDREAGSSVVDVLEWIGRQAAA